MNDRFFDEKFKRHRSGVDPDVVRTCDVCAKYAEQGGPLLVICYHLAICSSSDDPLLVMDPDFPRCMVPEAARTMRAPDFYQQLLVDITAKVVGLRTLSSMFPHFYKESDEQLRFNYSEEKDIFRAFSVAAKKSRKVESVVDGSKIGEARRLRDLQLLLSHCQYPKGGDHKASSSLLPDILLKRATLLIKKPPLDIDYHLVLVDLALIDGQWLELLPPAEHHNLFYLKTLCQIKLKLFADAKVSLEKTEESLRLSNLTQEDKDRMANKLQAGRSLIEKNGSLNVPLRLVPEKPVLLSANPRFPALSSKVDVVSRPPEAVSAEEMNRRLPQETPEQFVRKVDKLLYQFLQPMRTRGRGVVANATIAAGEIVAVEDPVVATLRHDLLYATHTHCHHCLTPTRHLLPCPDCCLVMFCSLGCKDAALSSYHRFECVLGLPLLSIAYGPSFERQVCLTLRLLFSHPPEFWMEKKCEFNYLKDTKFDMEEYLGGEVYSSNDLKHLFNLEHKEGCMRNLDNSCLKNLDIIGGKSHYKVVFVAEHVQKLVWDSGYMKGRSDDVSDIVAKVVHNVIRVARLNSVVMTEEVVRAIARPEEADFLVEGVYGQGIYNTVSLFNHSCTRNAVRFNVGNKTVVVARRTIHPGEEVNLAYMYHLLAYPDFFRTNQLASEFNFLCDCRICSEKWPGLSQSELMDPAWPDPTFVANSNDVAALREKNFERLRSNGLEVNARMCQKIASEMQIRGFDVEKNAKRAELWNDVGAVFLLRPLRIKYCVQLKW